MLKGRKTPLERHRQHRKEAGIVRVEVQVPREDAPLLRHLARDLRDPSREEAARAMLRRTVGAAPVGLKALLASAPLEGIPLDRSPDTGRDVDL